MLRCGLLFTVMALLFGCSNYSQDTRASLEKEAIDICDQEGVSCASRDDLDDKGYRCSGWSGFCYHGGAGGDSTYFCLGQSCWHVSGFPAEEIPDEVPDVD